jgi:hypothetical protein
LAYRAFLGGGEEIWLYWRLAALVEKSDFDGLRDIRLKIKSRLIAIYEPLVRIFRRKVRFFRDCARLF